MKSFESRLTIFLSYSFIQRARAGALVLVSLHSPEKKTDRPWSKERPSPEKKVTGIEECEIRIALTDRTRSFDVSLEEWKDLYYSTPERSVLIQLQIKLVCGGSLRFISCLFRSTSLRTDEKGRRGRIPSDLRVE